MKNTWPGAVEHLIASDPTMARIVAEVGDYKLSPQSDGTHFESVARAIVYQQLSGKAAATIYRRVVELLGGPPAPRPLLAAEDSALMEAGLSGQKLRYLKDLAARCESGEVHIERMHELPDEQVISELTRVKGVGLWTAQMFLMFRLTRPDVLPVLDLGIRKAIQLHYNLESLPAPDAMHAIAAPWRPYATPACLYLWRSLDTPAPTDSNS